MDKLKDKGNKMKKILLDYNLIELKSLISEMGEKSFRAGQIFTALHMGLDFSEMTTLPLSLRNILTDNYISQPVKIIKTLVSKDKTQKFLFALSDGNVVEGVLMQYKYGATLCVSTQVGCRMNCAFCASGINGLIRNMSAGEILGEIIAVNKFIGGGLKQDRKVTNIVLMGSGEPLDNYDNVVNFVKLLSDKDGINISARNVSLSTCGLVDKMLKLANENLPLNLTVSLHSPFDEEREKIMPVAKKYKISDILNACHNFFEKTGRRYIFEYVLINGENDGIRHAEALIKLLKGRPCHVNLIRLNEVKEKNLKGVADKEAYKFLSLLEKGGLSATVRRIMGSDIDGACGQLRQRYLEEGEF